MKKFRLSILLLVLALVLAIVPAVLAQDTLGASQGDYDLWTSANTTTAAFNTVTYNFTAKLNTTGMSDPTQSVSANITGQGVIDKTDMNNPSFQLDVTGTLTQGTQTTNVNGGVRIVGGNIYYTSDGTTWTGMKLSDALNEAQQAAGAGIASQTGTTPDLSSGGLSNMMSNPQAQAAMAALAQLKPSDFVTLTRADENGQAHFTLDISISKLLSSDSFKSMMAAMAASSATAATEEANSAQMMAMAQMMFTNAKIDLDQYADPNTKLISRTVFNFSLPLDSMGMAGATVAATFDISLSNYNQPVTVTAPANATMMATEAAS